MRIIVLVVFVMAVLASASAQDFRHFFGLSPLGVQVSVMRDPRSNRGPVLFPPGPAPNNADTSGVVVGASGYGFVPPSTGNLFGF